MPPRSPVRYASVDVSSQCPVRCAHCYFYRNPVEGEDLPDESFLAAIKALRDATSVDCMLWLGGEPLTRPKVVVQGAQLFRRNALFTNGLLPIPDDFPGGVAVSLDGAAASNDRLRGEGAFQRVLDNLGGGADRLFHCTVTRSNMDSMDALAHDLDRAGAAGLLFGLYSPRMGETGGWALNAAEQESVVDQLVEIRKEHAIVMNTPDSLELMRPASVPGVAAGCMYRTGDAVAFDHRLAAKHPCSYGAGADCARCGCAALFLRGAALRGDGRARQVLGDFFRAR